MNSSSTNFSSPLVLNNSFGSWNWYLEANSVRWDAKTQELFELDTPVFGGPFNEVINFVVNEDKQKIIEAFEKAVLEHNVLNLSLRIRTKSGVKNIRMLGSVTYKDGEPSQVSGFVWHDQDAQMVSEIEKNLETHSRMTSLGQVAATIAHEINTPLTSIMFRVEYLLNQTKQTPEAQTQLKQIVSTVQKISKITEGVKQVARDGAEDPFESVNLQSLIQDVYSLCENKTLRHKVKLTSEIDYNGKIYGRQVQLTQVLVNLINNSVDAIKDQTSPWIKIKISSQNSQVIIKVQDSGLGIKPEVAAKIFKPFFSTKPQGEGTGLGLGLSKKIVEQHKGTLVVDTTEMNTTFVLTMPISA